MLAFTISDTTLTPTPFFRANINGVYLESKGNKFTREQLDRLGKLKPGNSVIITDIRAKGPDGKEIRLSPIPLTLN